MSARDLTPERRNELIQWASLRLSPTHLARMYGVTIWDVYRIRWRQGIWSNKAGRYAPVPTETVKTILDELRADSKRGRRTELARRYGLAASTVSRIGSSGGIPKMSCGRRSRHNKETLRRLAEAFA